MNKEKIDQIFYDLKHELITEKEAHQKVLNALSSPSLGEVNTELLDCIKNLMGFFDTPIARMKMPSEDCNEVRKIGRAVLEKYKNLQSGEADVTATFPEDFWRQLFKNMSNCYADTREENLDTDPPSLIEGKVIQAMDEDQFIQVLKENFLSKQNSQLSVPKETTTLSGQQDLCDCGYACNTGTNICSGCGLEKPKAKTPVSPEPELDEDILKQAKANVAKKHGFLRCRAEDIDEVFEEYHRLKTPDKGETN